MQTDEVHHLTQAIRSGQVCCGVEALFAFFLKKGRTYE